MRCHLTQLRRARLDGRLRLRQLQPPVAPAQQARGTGAAAALAAAAALLLGPPPGAARVCQEGVAVVVVVCTVRNKKHMKVGRGELWCRGQAMPAPA